LYRIGIKRISLAVIIKPPKTIYYSLCFIFFISAEDLSCFYWAGSAKTDNENFEYFLLLRRATKTRLSGV
jgi:hypothetical protein